METRVYPIVLSKDGNGYLVNIPDFEIDTEGNDLADAIFMARDAIGIMGIQMQDDGEVLPVPFQKEFETNKGEIVSYVDIDFDEYRKKHDNRMVRKNLTIPYYLNVEAEKQGLNFSRILQDALQEKLGL